MYAIVKDDSVIATQAILRWIKRQENGVAVMTQKEDGDAVLVDGTIYAIRGHETEDGREVVDLVEVQDSTEERTARLTAAIERGMTK